MGVEKVYCRNCGSSFGKSRETCPDCGFENIEYEPNNNQRQQPKGGAAGPSEQPGPDSQKYDSIEQVKQSDSSERIATNESARSKSATDEHDESAGELTGSETRADSAALADIVSEVKKDTTPESPTARKLCQTLSDEMADESDIETALEEAIEQLETADSVTRIAEKASRRGSIGEYESLERDLAEEGGSLPESIRSLTDQLIQTKQELDQQKEQWDELIDELESVCDQAGRTDGITFKSKDTRDRVSELGAALRSGDLTVTEPMKPVESVAEEVDRRTRPSSTLSRELLDTLQTPENSAQLEQALYESVEMIEEYGEFKQMLSEIEVEDVRRRLDSLDRELVSMDTPIYSHLSDRIRELEALIDDPETINDIQLYAIYQEVSFYDRTLLPRLSRSMARDASGDGDEMLETVRRRIEEIDSEFVSVRPDHNHSIPKHFLGLAEELSADAEQELRSHPERAAGVLLAADAVLDHVEELYERNEYSVMLRRLRG